MSVTINGTNGLTFNDASTQNTAATGFGFKNRIINGAMMIDQRNAGASVTALTAAGYTLDRWQQRFQTPVAATTGQSSTAPSGFSYSNRVTITTGGSVGSSDRNFLLQPIEGYNVADLGFGDVGASTVTVSFWVQCSISGSFSGALQNSAANRSYPFSYTINSTNTWEYKTITIAGDTTGTWLKTNGIGLSLWFDLGNGSALRSTANSWQAGDYRGVAGSQSIVGTSGATFYITGVQLEKGSTATSFDYRPYGTELALCQRYYQNYLGGPTGYGYFGSGVYTSATNVRLYMPLLVPMRSNPSFGTSGSFYMITGNATSDAVSAVTYDNGNTTGVALNVTCASRTAGFGAVMIAASSGTSSLSFSSEL